MTNKPDEPFISVIIPFKNEEKTIPIALDSLAIQEVDFSFEVILADGCSTDQSAEVIMKHPLNSKTRITILPLPEDNHGMTVARNRAAEIAKGKYMLFMQADIRVTNTKALSLIEQAFDDKDVVGTFAIGLSADAEFKNYDFWSKVMMARYHGSICNQDFSTKLNGVRADVFRQMGGFDEERFAWGGEDFEFMSRLMKKGTIAEMDIKFEHLHAIGGRTTAYGILKKYCRNAEVMGATIPVYIKNRHLQEGITYMLIQECMLCALGLSCLVPYAWPWSPILLFLAGIAWQKDSYRYIRDWRLIYLPFFSFAGLLCFTYYFLKGLILKQTSVSINQKPDKKVEDSDTDTEKMT